MPISPLVFRAAADVPSKPAPAQYFSGAVQVESMASPDAFALEVLRVSFFPGGRTGWHTHPVGQVLLVSSGNGIVATRDGARRMTIGDVIEIPAGVEHWHGAAPGTPMSHIAMQPGGATAWLERVSDEDYERLCAGAA